MNFLKFNKVSKFLFLAMFIFFNASNVKANAAMFFLPKVENNIVVPFLSVEDDGASAVHKMYDSLNLNAFGLSQAAFNYAIKGFENLKSDGKLLNDHVISIVDFTKLSSEKRLYVLDIKSYKILFNTYVAHGQGSGQAMATNFSNVPESLQSSLGFYKTSSTYYGKNGFSLKLHGFENGINDKAAERSIVLHGALYVSEDFINSQGYIGRSWGCPAVPEKLNRPIIEKIKNGSCLFIYSQNKSYLQQSRLLNN